MQVMVEVVVLAIRKGVFVRSVAAIELPIHPLRLGDALLNHSQPQDRAWLEASFGSVLVVREVIAMSPAWLCQIPHLSSWAVCSTRPEFATRLRIRIHSQSPLPLTCCRLSVAAPLFVFKAKAIGAALALTTVTQDAFISTAPTVNCAVVVGSALSSEDEENEEESFFDPLHPLSSGDSGLLSGAARSERLLQALS